MRLVCCAFVFTVFIYNGSCSKNKRATLIWFEPFDTLDLNTWNHLVTAWGGGNEEFQYYRNNRKNSFVKDGMLHIRPTPVAAELEDTSLFNGSITERDCNMEPCVSYANPYRGEITAPFYSARLRTKGSFGFKYGKIEVRAKLPRGDWLWPAIWFLPVNSSVYGGWPSGGEIDLMESRGNVNYTSPGGHSQGVNKVGSTLHFGPRPPFNGFMKTNFERMEPPGKDYSQEFYTYELHWTENSISFYVDDDLLGTVTPPEGGFWKLGDFDVNPGGENIWAKGGKMAPFDQEFFIILNVAVGGKFFGDGWDNNGQPRPWEWSSGKPKRQFWDDRENWLKTWEQPELVIDHILVYKYN